MLSKAPVQPLNTATVRSSSIIKVCSKNCIFYFFELITGLFCICNCVVMEKYGLNATELYFVSLFLAISGLPLYNAHGTACREALRLATPRLRLSDSATALCGVSSEKIGFRRS